MFTLFGWALIFTATAGVGQDNSPIAPTTNDVIFCRVQTSLFLRDPDYDVVAYRYQWNINNGIIVRDVVNAALSDTIPKANQVGDIVTCSVAPTDGQLEGPSATQSVTVTAG